MATPEVATATPAGDVDAAGVMGRVPENDAVSVTVEDAPQTSTSTETNDGPSYADVGAGASAADDLEDDEQSLAGMASLSVRDGDGSHDSPDDESSPQTPIEPDVFDRLGYGDSASETHEFGERSSVDDDDDLSDDEDEEYDDAATLFLDAIVAVADGQEELDAPYLGTLARSLAREVGVILEDDDLTQLADAPRAVQVVVRRVADLATALTLTPRDLLKRGPGKTTIHSPCAGSYRIVTLEIVAALVGCSITEAREAVARCPVIRRRKEEDEENENDEETSTSGRDNSAVLTPITAAAAMLFAYGQSTPLQCAGARVLCAALTVAEEPAWSPLLLGGWGERAALEGVTPKIITEEDTALAKLPLHERLAACAEIAVALKPGKHPCVVGMAMIVAETLRDAQREAEEFEEDEGAALEEEQTNGDKSDVSGRAAESNGANDTTTPPTAAATESADIPNKTTPSSPQKQSDDGWSKTKLTEALRNSKSWRDACDDETGALRVFENATRGPLCGPKPFRGISIEDFASAGGFSGGGGGRRMTGGDLLQVLQRLGGVRMATESPAEQ